MCIEILVIKNGNNIYCNTVGELASALELPPESVSEDDEVCCLCNAFFEHLGARKATDEEGFPFPEYVIEVK